MEELSFEHQFPENGSLLEVDQPLFQFSGINHTAPFQTSVNNFISRQLFEIRTDYSTAPTDLSKSWKRRLREFIQTKANTLLEPLTRSISSHPTLGPAEYLIRRFGYKNFQPNNRTLEHILKDLSGSSTKEEINAILDSIGSTGVQRYNDQTQALYDLYKESGERVMQQESILKIRLTLFDKIQDQLAGLSELQDNEEFKNLSESIEKYLEKVFENNSIKEAYESVIESYSRFNYIRDILVVRRTSSALENDPICSICCEEPIMYATTPCGHTYCNTCIRKQGSSCFICRGMIKDRIRLYMA
jgi:hypothetical protein